MNNPFFNSMITIRCEKTDYEYDVYSLVKAFYPAEELLFIKDKAGQETEATEGEYTDNKVKKDKSGFITETKENELTNDRNVLIEEKGNSLRLECHFDGNSIEEMFDASGEKTEVKNRFKFYLYQCLSKITGKELPWGNLTGIRPTKLAMMMLEQNKSHGEIKKFLQETHCVSDEKCELGIRIAESEKAILDRLDCTNGYSLYIGIPFCPTTCLYCSFTSNPIFKWKNRMQEYIEALKKEIDFLCVFYKDKPLNTIYIGGGTPTSLSAEHLDELISYVKAKFDLSFLLEFTVEAGRPDSITREKLEILYRHGITRISVNPQTMNQETLDLIGRCHTIEQTREAFALAREVGFDNINMDIILGLPGEDATMVAKTLAEIQEMNPDSLTAHSLAIKRASKLGEWIEKNGRETLNDTTDMMDFTLECARALDMKPYYLYRQKNMAGNLENVGFAKEGKEGIYNILIMEEKQTIVACGAGSITKRVYPDGRIERCDNVKDVSLYIEKIEEMIERKRKLLAD